MPMCFTVAVLGTVFVLLSRTVGFPVTVLTNVLLDDLCHQWHLHTDLRLVQLFVEEHPHQSIDRFWILLVQEATGSWHIPYL
uniref:Putative secreted peptide n=1 Tax=Anopheles braziliensis TaxID=58242 RepID=A0A2M3ZVZ4_9DIPT